MSEQSDVLKRFIRYCEVASQSNPLTADTVPSTPAQRMHTLRLTGPQVPVQKTFQPLVFVVIWIPHGSRLAPRFIHVLFDMRVEYLVLERIAMGEK